MAAVFKRVDHKVLEQIPSGQASGWIDTLCAVPIEFDLGGQRCRWLTWGCTTGSCRDRVSHIHSFHEACYVVRGRGSFALDGRVHPVRRGQMFLSRPGQPHQITESPTHRMAIICWAFSLTPDATAAGSESDADLLSGWIGGGPAVNQGAHELTATLILLLGEASRRRAGMNIAVRALAARLLVETMRLTSDHVAGAHPPEPQQQHHAERVVRLAQRFIHDNQARPIRVTDVARHVHLSSRHLTRLFRVQTGRTIAQHLADQRIEKAKDLLLYDPSAAVKQVAAACGYRDVKHFSRLFTKQVGLSPSRFRDQGGTRFL